METIIRIEHPLDGKGLWRSSHAIWIDSLYNRHASYQTGGMPTPCRDGIAMSDNLFCAYLSLEQIKQWILQEEFVQVIEAGFFIYMLKVSKCQKGGHQVCYDKNDILEKTNITELFK